MGIYNIIGMMSGTSLDGVDLVHCTFEEKGGHYVYSINACETKPYPEFWTERLKSLPAATAEAFCETHVAYGNYCGELVKEFSKSNHLEAEFVASHGHTIFHQPAKHFTTQIGDGAAISAVCGLPVVCDFRSADVAAGGQGAPLVPVGDELLFGTYDYCLNLGGFANVSMRKNGQRIAFDISPANIVLNHFSKLLGSDYDKGGEIAATGSIDRALLDELNGLSFYSDIAPKSLGREWVENSFFPVFENYELEIKDILCTCCEHIAFQVAASLEKAGDQVMLVTGGGAFNTFLLSRIASHSPARLFVPDEKIVNFKEALIFAFLGLLRMQQKPNILASVTGAQRDVCGGAVYLP